MSEGEGEEEEVGGLLAWHIAVLVVGSVVLLTAILLIVILVSKCTKSTLCNHKLSCQNLNYKGRYPSNKVPMHAGHERHIMYP